MYRTKAIYQLSDLKQSSWKILRLFEIYRQSGSQAPVDHTFVVSAQSGHLKSHVLSTHLTCIDQCASSR